MPFGFPGLPVLKSSIFFSGICAFEKTGSAKNPTMAKGTFIFKSALGWQMLVPRRVRAEYAHFAVQMLKKSRGLDLLGGVS